MASSKEHYERVLSPVYSWMVGGFDAALERNTAFFDERRIFDPSGSGKAVDLGAGCGFQSIPLARRGFEVTAIDEDAGLLDELRSHAADLPIRTVEGDMLSFRDHVADGIELVVCMTDTLLHLQTRNAVQSLLAEVNASLEAGGLLVLTFRDLSRELKELDRFVSVKSDSHRIFTCFLEYEEATVKVHDLVHELHEDEWRLHKSYYRKLRLAPEWVENELRLAGFGKIDTSSNARLICIVAEKTG